MLINDEIEKILAVIETLDDDDRSFYYRFDYIIGIEDIFKIKEILAREYDIKTKFFEDKIYQMEF